MSIKERLKKWLGIWDLEYRIAKLDAETRTNRDHLYRQDRRIVELERQARVNREAIEKAIDNRMDLRSEFSKERQDESDKIGRIFTMGGPEAVKAFQKGELADEIIKRLEAEDAARRHTEGKMNG